MTQWMNPAVRQAYDEAVAHRRLAQGQVIYLHGDDATEMYRIVSGTVRLLTARSDGREVVFLRFGPGDCFGEASLIDREPRPQTAQAVTDVELEVLGGGAFAKLRSGHRNFDEALLRLLSRQMRFANKLFIDLSLNDLVGRVARRLVEAAMAFGERDEDGSSLEFHLSQAEIASMVGASRQSVNRALQQLQAMGVISTEYSGIRVHDLARLRDLAALGDDEIVADLTD
jgi:CRP-like cAMP-binding protein